MANSSSTVSSGQIITAAQYNNLRTDAIGPYGDERVFPDNILLKFGTGGDGSMYHDGTDLIIEPRVVGSGNLIINDAAILFLNDTANANMTVGLTVNQGANDDEILALKSSDVAHGRTGVAETDTYGSLKKVSATLGGLQVDTLGEDAALTSTLAINARGGTADTAKTTAAIGLVNIFVAEITGNSDDNITADGNVFAVRARTGGSGQTRLLVDEDGDLYSVTAAQTFDEYDDLSLIENYDRIRSGFGTWTREHEQQLIDLKILGAPVSEGGLTNYSQLVRALTGTVRQLGARLQIAEKKLAALPEGN